MEKESHSNHLTKLSLIGVLVTLGIVFGDIGTSPLYVMNAIISNGIPNKEFIYGAISCIFWTLTLQTTLKYVVITLRADNKGEGGILSLYALIRTRFKRIYILAIIGAATLLADGIITPAITVTSAIEGLETVSPTQLARMEKILNSVDLHKHQPQDAPKTQTDKKDSLQTSQTPSLAPAKEEAASDSKIPVIPIVLSILAVLFISQQFGTNKLGKFFGPVMFLWFFTLGAIGLFQIFKNPINVLNCLNPYYAWNLLVNYPGGFFILGAVFLCTTGAEALYSDLGHCGLKNIRISWIFVKITLILNYIGQGAWILSEFNKGIDVSTLGLNPFFFSMPVDLRMFGVIISTFAAVIASQALISGSFTIISEAIPLNLWPKVRLVYPSTVKGQMYIPVINWFLCLGCMFVVLFFEESKKMEAAYGLSITITMLMTSLLLSVYLYRNKVSVGIIAVFLFIYLSIETAFLAANLSKFMHGGWFTVMMAGMFFTVMFVWFKGRAIKKNFTGFDNILKYTRLLKDMKEDTAIPKFCTHLIYLTRADSYHDVERSIIYSLFNKQPKRADLYWLIHLDILDDPHTQEYSVDEIIEDTLIRVEFRVGFKVQPKINLFFRTAIQNLLAQKRVDLTSRYESLRKHNIQGDFKFVITDRVPNYEIYFSPFDRSILSMYNSFRHLGISDFKAFGLDTSNVIIEKVPLAVSDASCNMIEVPPHRKVRPDMKHHSRGKFRLPKFGEDEKIEKEVLPEEPKVTEEFLLRDTHNPKMEESDEQFIE